ncbi:hypothetical protein CQA49_07950 [Helicobacter sp. MIT 00-7814]|nr:hypothetical protein CQA49_07950 [Helicobacter sp. MIT 00-7814]RDU55922.1 hypothetical protein CQA37_03240 [Helicobacter sp. MIT 99-10781]
MISGFGFTSLFLAFLNTRFFQAPKPSKIFVIFNCLLMLSGVIFLLLYVYFTHGATGAYDKLDVFSPTRTFVVAILGAPLVSIAMPCMFLYRLYRVVKYKDSLNIFWDSVLLIALAYFCAFLMLGMGSFHYFMPANVLVCLYGLFFLNLYGRALMKSIILWGIVVVSGLILALNTIPQGLHYFTLNKTQMRNMQDSMEFLAKYIKENPGTTLYFDGFCRGRDRCYYYWQYGAVFDILPRIYGVEDFDIKSNEPNGKNFTPKPDAKFSFYANDEVSEPKSGDLLFVSFMSDKAISQEYIKNLKEKEELLFETDNFGYIPSYNLMSFGALALQKLGIKHSLNNMGNPLRLPSQMYVFRIR